VDEHRAGVGRRLDDASRGKLRERNTLCRWDLCELSRRQAVLHDEREESLLWRASRIERLKYCRMCNGPVVATAHRHAFERRIDLRAGLRVIAPDSWDWSLSEFELECDA
jgi:hypothetical protein